MKDIAILILISVLNALIWAGIASLFTSHWIVVLCVILVLTFWTMLFFSKGRR